MYIPSHFHIDEIKVAYDIIKENSFATLEACVVFAEIAKERP
ncbi:hypothetical protein [Paenibacillus phytorum]|nr:hypothetical protein [Paenibacillus phytorum]